MATHFSGNSMDRGAWWAIVHGGHKRVRYDLATKQHACIYIYTHTHIYGSND